ncbi:hypothetical protein [Actinomadura citrea]|uniref:Uncharacterized protein n=1 Tax=Actinomadura citrea TaxID=46158 RepID=A0A7Y9GAB1_9ACTN|nr:hypothetical protein [Actinomadura citrea]NYE12859.1 hypothetical protein [Actinomadura citrea]GGT54981.1 hypothetical protein GCM10010177_09220 [Actinomadura citrea]
MRLSSSLPPAGFTRGEPRPPVRRPSRLSVVIAALALVAGLILVIAYGTTRLAPARPADGVTTPVPSARPSPASSPPPGRDVAEPRANPSRRHAGHKKRARRGEHAAASPRRHHHTVRRHHRPAKRKPPRARHAPPRWVSGECKRRFPYNPARGAACVGALTGAFG